MFLRELPLLENSPAQSSIVCDISLLCRMLSEYEMTWSISRVEWNYEHEEEYPEVEGLDEDVNIRTH